MAKVHDAAEQHVTEAPSRGIKRSLKYVDGEKSGAKDEGADSDYAAISKIPAISIEQDKPYPSGTANRSDGSSLAKGDSLALEQQALRLHQMLWDIFANRFETQVGIWIGSACCPFKSTYTAPTRLISRLALTLTSYRRRLVDSQLAASVEPVQVLSRSDKDSLRQALLSAVHAYAARWLSFEDASSPTTTLVAAVKNKEDLVKSLWTRAQKRIYSPMTQPTYCSILALHLFGHTPAPPDFAEPNMRDVCVQASLQHLKTLSAQSRLLSSTNAKTVLISTPIDSTVSPSDITPLEYAQMEDIAYWFGIMCDTSRSLVKCQPPIISDAVTTDGQIWSQVRDQVDEFKASCKNWRNSRVPISIDVLYGVVGHGTACRAMVWSAISRVQDALFHHLSDISVEAATQIALREFDRFNMSFEYLLGLCKRDFILLNEKIRVTCFLLNIDHSLGILTLIDMLAAAGYAHLLPSEYELRLSAAREMANSARIAVHVDQTSTGSPLSNSILLQSPYPENVVDALYRAGNSIIYLYKNKTLSISMVEAMFSLMLQGLRVLQIVSATAYTAYNNLMDACNDVGVKPKPIPDYSTSSLLTPEPSQPAEPNMNLFETEALQELEKMVVTNNGLMEQTISRYERELGLASV
ncbi:MAG: hypothetical protein M1822_004879 [Bathelium mastoideum]|nr:MAG: hypothetical protein M1822_004879 [Bathelium mastoideum]